uniref:SFRICE_024653 n=1 Tax=Spodoptera frugiperda TaxID=7108 RepID=A0A2H1WHN5_SPOFR
MAIKLFTLFTLCVFLNIVFSYPTGNEIKTHVSAEDKKPSEYYNVKFDVPDETKFGVVKRTKRNVIHDGHQCSEGEIWFMNQCMSQETYEEMMGEDKR